MSPKELLYIDDALGHTQFLMTQCREAANRLTDPALRRQAMERIMQMTAEDLLRLKDFIR